MARVTDSYQAVTGFAVVRGPFRGGRRRPVTSAGAGVEGPAVRRSSRQL